MVLVPGCDVALQISSCLWSDRSVAGDVEENQVKGNKVSDEPQQHHWVPPEAVALVQHPKDAPSCSDRERGLRGMGGLHHEPRSMRGMSQKTHL